jgi:adenylate cyclase
MSAARRLASILVADAVGYAHMMERSEQDTHRRVMALITHVIPRILVRHQGQLIKTTGDGVMATFSNVLDAVRCGVQLQKILVRQARGNLNDQIKFRLGLNVGDIIFEKGDAYGDCVNVAVRIVSLAEPGGICVSAAVFDQVRNKVPFVFESLGRPALKNIAEPPEVFRLKTTGKSNTVEQAYVFPAPSILSNGLHSKRPAILVNRLDSPKEDIQAGEIAWSFTRELSARLQNCGTFQILRSVSGSSAPVGTVKVQHAPLAGSDETVFYHIDGHILRSAGTVRAVIQLLDAVTGFQIWAGVFDLRTDDLLRSQERAIFSATAHIEADIQRHEFGRNASKVPCQEDWYGRTQLAYWHYYRRSKDENETALRHFNEVIAGGPGYALALAGAAACHFWAGQQLWASDSVRSMHLAKEQANKAVMADPRLPWARLILAQSQLFLGHHNLAVAEAKRAAGLNPTSPAIKAFLGHALTAAGNSSAAIPYLRSAFNIAPYHGNRFMWLSNLALAHFHMRRFSRAAEAAAEAADLAPDHWLANQVRVASLVRLGQLDEAKFVLDRIRLRERETGHDKLSNRLPYKNNDDLQYVVQALYEAGWEERS